VSLDALAARIVAAIGPHARAVFLDGDHALTGQHEALWGVLWPFLQSLEK
jgi:hypothetical protein